MILATNPSYQMGVSQASPFIGGRGGWGGGDQRYRPTALSPPPWCGGSKCSLSGARCLHASVWCVAGEWGTRSVWTCTGPPVAVGHTIASGQPSQINFPIMQTALNCKMQKHPFLVSKICQTLHVVDKFKRSNFPFGKQLKSEQNLN
jgi:hypothetical protein